MAGRAFIVLGDGTDHGGAVIEASQMSDTHGKGIARVGDQVTCPRPGHGTTVIVTGDPTMIIDGKPAARHGDKCACGATLISSQAVSTVGGGGGGGSSSQSAGTQQSAHATEAVVAASASAMPALADAEDEVLEQYFSLLDDQGNPVDGYRYDLFENGALKVKAGSFSTGHTTAIQGNTTIDMVYWLNKAGATKS
jgi:uncharacterized Zn-binding protein involved in type VI secretion